MRAVLWLVVALAAACGTPPRPVGLPAPEYEEPRVEPWSPPAPQPVEAAAEPPPGDAVPEAAPGASVEPAPVLGPAGAGGSGATLPAGTP